jgi:hypothetical protein
MSLLSKIIGGIVFALGLLIVILFPSMRDYQFDQQAFAGIVFGFVLMAVGFLLMWF